MRKIIIGTTPTIQYTFSTINPSDITNATMTIRKNGNAILEKELSDATVGEDSLTWTLTQAETLALGTGESKIMLNFLLSNGTRGASRQVTLKGLDNHVSEVMT